jgi:hypothetical protein
MKTKVKYVYVVVGHDFDTDETYVYGAYRTKAKAVRGAVDEFAVVWEEEGRRPKNLAMLTEALGGQMVFAVERTPLED